MSVCQSPVATQRVLQGGKQKAHTKTWKNEHDEKRIQTLIKHEINN